MVQGLAVGMKQPIKLRSVAVMCIACAILAAVLPSCGQLPQNPQQSIYATKSGFSAALSVISNYQARPVCATQSMQALTCKQPATEKRLVALANSTSLVLDDAEKAVRTPGFGADSAATLIASAQASLQALTTITDALQK